MKNSVFGDQYQIKDFLEKDLNSNIYFAIDLDSNDIVVIRIFSKEYSRSIQNPEEFLHLNQSISYLAQPGHVEILDWGIDNEQMFSVWPGESVETVEKVLATHATFEPDMAVSIIKSSAACLSQVFDEVGVGHYALSPKNIYLASKGSVKIAEVGFAAQLFKDENFLNSGLKFYDWQYQAPEVFLNGNDPDIRSDMFSLGYCLYTMITGRKPFEQKKPVSLVDYKQTHFTPEEQNQLGKTFIKLFHNLTALNAVNRFHSWPEALKAMEYYLKEDKFLKKSALSGRMRSMTSNVDLNAIKEDNENFSRERKSRKEKRAVIPASDIRQISTIYISEHPNKLHKKRLRFFASRKSEGSNTGVVIIAAAVVLIAIILFFLVVQLQTNSESQEAANKELAKKSLKNDSVKIINDKPKKVSAIKDKALTGNENKPVDRVIIEEELPNPGKKTIPTDLDTFNELTFQVRELTIRNEWLKALQLLDTYSGPLKEKQDLLKKEIVRKHTNFMENKGNIQKKINSKSIPLHITPEVDDTPSLENLANLIYSGNIEGAFNLIPLVEVSQKIDLTTLKTILDRATDTGLAALMADTYSKQIGKEIEISLSGNLVKGKISQVLADEESLKLNLVFLSRQIERVFPFEQIDPLINVSRIVGSDANETTLLQFIYLIKNRQFKAAQQKLQTYNGVLKKELLQAMAQVKNDEAELFWNKLLAQVGIPPETPEKDFNSKLIKTKMTEDDSWVFNFRLNEFSERYSSTPFYQKVKPLTVLTANFFKKKLVSLKKPDAIVSPTGRPGTLTLDTALERVSDGGTIRILPGFYKDPISLNKKIRLIGTKEVYFGSYVTLNAERSELRNVILEKGFMDISRNIRDVKIYNCIVAQGSIILRGDNSGVKIENSVFYGLKVGKNLQTSILDCVILENPDKGANYTIHGYISGTVTNTIIRSNNDYAINITERNDNSLLLRHCMVFGSKGIGYISKSNTSIQAEADFNKYIGRAINLKIAKPQFIDENNLDFRLKDFTPGFFEGENKKSIGVQNDY